MDRSISESAILRDVWEQGWQNGLIQVAINMLLAKMDVAQIVALTGLSINQFNSIQHDLVNYEFNSLGIIVTN